MSDTERFKDFANQQQQYRQSLDDIDELVVSLDTLKQNVPPAQKAQVETLITMLKSMKSEINETAQSLERKKYGAKYQIATENGEYTNE